MKIKRISRKVTGSYYDNIELEAEITVADDIYEVANQLDELAKNLLDDIYKKAEAKREKELKKETLQRKVKRFLSVIDAASPEQINRILNETDPDLPF